MLKSEIPTLPPVLNLMLEILCVCQMFHNAISMNSLLFRSMSILLALLRRRHSDSQDNNEIQRTFLLYILRLYFSKQSLYRKAHTPDSFTKRSPRKPSGYPSGRLCISPRRCHRDCIPYIARSFHCSIHSCLEKENKSL